jgi:hypothetical protein
MLASLRRLSPAKVRVYAGDDDSRDIAVPARRRKWSQVIEAIEARSWTRCELLDKSGAVLGYIENAEPAGELEELEPGQKSKTRSDVEWMVGVITKAQRDAMTFRDAEVTNLLRAQGDVVREMVAAMHSLHAINEAKVSAAADVARLQAQAESSDGAGQLKELLDAAPQLLGMLPAIRQLLGGKSS